MRRAFLVTLIAAVFAGGSLLIPRVRTEMRGILRPEPPAQITPLAVSLPPEVEDVAVAAPSTTPGAAMVTASPATPTVSPAPSQTAPPQETASLAPTMSVPTESPTPSSEPPSPTVAPSPTSAPVAINGRVYDAYIPAATKEGQAYQYSCEFDAAWAILQTYGFDVQVDDLIPLVGIDASIEPYVEETADGFVIHGGDITTAFSGDYKGNFLARSSAMAVRKAFEHYGLETTLVSERGGVEAALLRGELVWIKTTVDFKPWRPATWRMPDGRTYATVLGNDHAVVVMGFNAETVVIRDVLGPTSTNRQRPYEYEVSWETFMAAWGAQSFDGLAVARPAQS